MRLRIEERMKVWSRLGGKYQPEKTVSQTEVGRNLYDQLKAP